MVEAQSAATIAPAISNLMISCRFILFLPNRICSQHVWIRYSNRFLCKVGRLVVDLTRIFDRRVRMSARLAVKTGGWVGVADIRWERGGETCFHEVGVDLHHGVAVVGARSMDAGDWAFCGLFSGFSLRGRNEVPQSGKSSAAHPAELELPWARAELHALLIAAALPPSGGG